MPLAGRAADRFNLATVYGISAGRVRRSARSRPAARRSLDALIAARVVQGAGAGAIFPLATAAAGHLFEGPARARAIGAVGALSFLGMAVGPFVGATILQAFASRCRAAAVAELALGLLPGRAVRAARRDLHVGHGARLAQTGRRVGRSTWSAPPCSRRGVASGLIAVTSDRRRRPLGLDRTCAVMSVVALVARSSGSVAGAIRSSTLSFFRNRTFSGATSMALLTGYAFATALIGGAVFVDRVRYAGPGEQQLALGLAGRGDGHWRARVRIPGAADGRHGAEHRRALSRRSAASCSMSTARPESPLLLMCAGLALFGLGFGITVTSRTTGVLEALGRGAFGVGSAALTVARMLGMALGVSVLTVLGSNRIEALSIVLTNQAAQRRGPSSGAPGPPARGLPCRRRARTLGFSTGRSDTERALCCRRCRDGNRDTAYARNEQSAGLDVPDDS